MSEEKQEIDALLNNLEPSKFIDVKKFITSIQPAKKEDNSHYHLDPDLDNLPITEDKTGRRNIVPTLAKIIAESKCPYTFCINGGWGSGKTVFMKWIKEEIDRNYDATTFTHWFDPWKYESINNLTYPLIKEIEFYAPGKKHSENIRSFFVRILKLVPQIYSYFKFHIPFSFSSKIIEAFNSEGNIEKSFKRLFKLKKSFEDYIAYILYLYSEDEIQKEKFIIFVDDLDRCYPENTVILLESIKNFFSTDNCIFVLAIDREVLSEGIKSKYGNNIFFSGEDYLDKIIKFNYDLPSNAGIIITNFISTLKESNKDLFNDSVIENMAPQLFDLNGSTSIRVIKKIFNRYHLLSITLQQKQTSFDKDILFLTCFIFHLYPSCFTLIAKYRGRKLIDFLCNIKRDDLNKIDLFLEEWRRDIHKLVGESNIQEIVLRFKQFKFPGVPNVNNQTIADNYIKCSDILMKFSNE